MYNRRNFLKHSTTVLALLRATLYGEARKQKENPGSAPKYLILACDGGGMRGYLSTLILQRLNNDLNIFGANNQNIDLFAGTSTGGLIALGLAAGKSIDSGVELYRHSGAQIFNPLGLQTECLLAAKKKLKGVDEGAEELWQVLFDNIGNPSLRTVMEGFIPGNPLLSSLKTNVMVATFQLADPNATPRSWTPLTIDNFDGSPGANTALYDAALSTSAAPVYFPPYYHPKFGWCSDGGLFANNPSALALGRAIAAGHSLSDIALLSIGTGTTVASLSPTQATRLCFGIDYWASLEAEGSTPAFPLLNAILDGVSASTDEICSQLLGGSQNGGRYMRVSPALPKAVSLDDYSPATLRMFEKAASALFRSAEWTSVEQWVRTNFQK